eukprot:4268259-Amphidinium_carterae.1
MSEERVQRLLELIEGGGHVSKSLDESALKSCELLALVAPEFLVHRVAKLLERHRNCCVLWQYSADNTPIRARTWETLRAGGGARRASAKVTEEYFSQALFCSIETGEGEPCHASILVPPTILGHGKTMKALSAIAAEMPGLSLIGESSSIERCFTRFTTAPWCIPFVLLYQDAFLTAKAKSASLRGGHHEGTLEKFLHVLSMSEGWIVFLLEVPGSL